MATGFFTFRQVTLGRSWKQDYLTFPHCKANVPLLWLLRLFKMAAVLPIYGILPITQTCRHCMQSVNRMTCVTTTVFYKCILWCLNITFPSDLFCNGEKGEEMSILRIIIELTFFAFHFDIQTVMYYQWHDTLALTFHNMHTCKSLGSLR